MQDDGDSTTGEGPEVGDDWADRILERARARSSGQPLTESEGPEEAGEPPAAPEAPEAPEQAAAPPAEPAPVAEPPRRPVLPTVEDPSPGAAPAPEEFEPFAEAYSRSGSESPGAEAAVFGEPEPLPPHLALDAPAPDAPPQDGGDIHIPGRAAGTARGVLEWVGVIVGALVVALLVKQFLFAAYYIPSPSMEPTLTDGDRIVVNKLSYRLHEVNRGDVVVFSRPPGQPDGIKDLIKRVVALPGETVEVVDGRVYVDGGLLLEPYLAVRDGTSGFPLPPGCLDAPGSISRCTVPDGHVFVMGDNRPNSKDSRIFGPIPESDIVGRAFLRVWPIGDVGRL